MCNLYSMTKSLDAFRALVRAMVNPPTNLPPLPGVFPDQMAPVVRQAGDARELLTMRAGECRRRRRVAYRSLTFETPRSPTGRNGSTHKADASCRRPASASMHRPPPKRPPPGSHLTPISAIVQTHGDRHV